MNETGTIEITTPQQVLCAAADLIEKEGWTRGTYQNYDGQYCALGAMRAIIFGTAFDIKDETTEQWSLLSETEAEASRRARLIHQESNNIIDFNDNRAASAEEVIALLRDGCE